MSELDKFIYTTTYRQDYGKDHTNIGIDSSAKEGKVECKPKAYQGGAVGRAYENPLGSCPCRPGGAMPRTAQGLPWNLDNPCGCSAEGATNPKPPNEENVNDMKQRMAETENANKDSTPCYPSNAYPLKHPPPLRLTQSLQCPPQEKFRPVAPGQFGGQFEGALNRKPKENDQAMPYSFNTPCVCPPGRPESGPQDYGPAWIRDRAREQTVEPRMTGGEPTNIPQDVVKLINEGPPAARVGSAPQSDTSKYDQPNTFMKKLYDKYPYLYQILRDTPPEELIERVFKDRFLSTYQVDYLHMGIGKEHFPKGGEQMTEKFVSPEGKPEPNLIPGCTYRPSKRSNFGLKKSTLEKGENEDKIEKEDDTAREEPRISEYMASISKLGGEIITEKLFKTSSNRAAEAAKTSY